MVGVTTSTCHIAAFTCYKFLGGAPKQSFDALFSLLVVSQLFSVYAFPDISHSFQGPNYLSVGLACHQLPKLPSSLAEFPRVPPSILTSFHLVLEEKKSLSFLEFSWLSPFQYLPGVDSLYPSILLTSSCIHPHTLVLKYAQLCLTKKKNNFLCLDLTSHLRAPVFSLLRHKTS